MGRPRSKNHNLPPRLHIKKGRFYYVVSEDGKRKWIPLGSDRSEALRLWAQYEGDQIPADEKRFEIISARFQRDEICKRAHRTQKDYIKALDNLCSVFGRMSIDEIRPTLVAEYLRVRGESSKVQANREIAVLSLVFNQAREWGFTERANPCAGVRKHKEMPRTRYVEDSEYQAVWNCADDVVRDAMDLAVLTGQRQGDVLKMKVGDIRGGVLHVRQNKTQTALRIRVVGELEKVVERILSRQNRMGELLVQIGGGAVLTEDTLRKRFDKARTKAGVDFQFRDLRAKAATDTKDLAWSQKLLGHQSRAMTEDYVRPRLGEMVEPLR